MCSSSSTSGGRSLRRRRGGATAGGSGASSRCAISQFVTRYMRRRETKKGGRRSFSCLGGRGLGPLSRNRGRRSEAPRQDSTQGFRPKTPFFAFSKIPKIPRTSTRRPKSPSQSRPGPAQDPALDFPLGRPKDPKEPQGSQGVPRIPRSPKEIHADSALSTRSTQHAARSTQHADAHNPRRSQGVFQGDPKEFSQGDPKESRTLHAHNTHTTRTRTRTRTQTRTRTLRQL